MKRSQLQTYTILIFTFFSITICILLKIFIFYGFLASIILTFCILTKCKITIIELFNIIKGGLIDCKSLFILLALIGGMISTWISSGVVPAMLYYGIKYMQGMNFLLSIFIIMSVVSFFMGSGLGAVASVGIASLGLSKVFGIPNHILLGAIVSGAFIGDKISPLSGLFNLTLTTLNISYRKTIIVILKTLIPTYFITGLSYYFLGRKYNMIAGGSNAGELVSAITGSFTISPLLLLLPLGIIIMSFLGIKMVKSVFFNLIIGVIASIVFQNTNLYDIIFSIFTGYRANTSAIELNTILTTGGIISTVSVLLIVAGAISLSSIFQETELLVPIIDKITLRVKSREQLILITGLISSGLTAASDQSLGIILPGKFFKDRYGDMGLDNTILARTITDTGTAIALLIPWNVNSVFISSITSISTVTYAPYAILCYLSPIITFVFSYIYELDNG